MADIEIGGVKTGTAGQLAEDILYDNKFKDKAYLFEINLNTLMSLVKGRVKYEPISSYPVVKRDISLLVKSDIPESRIEEIIKNDYKYLIKGLNLFDLYKGEQVPEGHKSLTYNIVFQSDRKTLSETEINKAMDNIIRKLKSEINAELRS